MNFKRERIKEFYLKDTSVENFFIAEYMVDADGDFIKVYLTALMYADTDEMSNSLIARHLGLTEEDVLRAWNYWEEKGVIRKVYTDPHDRFHYAVEFLNLKERLYGASKDDESTHDNDKNGFAAELDDDVLRDVITTIEDITGRLIEGREPEAVISWIYEDGIEPELVKFAYRYCAEKRGQKRFSYISAVVREWKKAGILTVSDAEKYLDETDLRRSQYKRVMQALGFYRNPTEAEQQLIDKWLDVMEFSIDKVLEACSRTTGIGNPNFNYLNGILTNWYAKANGSDAAVRTGTEPGRAAAPKNAVALVNRLYEEIRRKNESIRNERRSAVFKSIPRIDEIESEIRRASMDLSRAAFNGGSSGGISADALKNRIRDLEAEEAYLLEKNGFPLDYLELQYECARCSDTGILDNGERCSCFSEKLKQFV